MSIALLARPEIRALRPYAMAPLHPLAIRLNANESTASAGGLHRYPEIRPGALHERLAAHFRVPAANLLATRGSSEAIDLLLRAFCSAGIDNVVISPPTFEMYRVYADIQGAETLEVPLLPDDDFRLDARRLLDACTAHSKLIVICSPNNPTGTRVPAEAIEEILVARRDQSVVVVDEAYIEFSGQSSLTNRMERFDNLVVLRTLSKAQGLAGARCGAVIGSEPLVTILDGILPPFAMSTPIVDCVLEALSGDPMLQAGATVASIVAERKRLSDALVGLPQVDRCWPSDGNFLLVRFHDINPVRQCLRAAKILVREFPGQEVLADCVRITVGTPAENDALLDALS